MQIIKKYSLKKSNTWMMGGTAAAFVMPDSIKDLSDWQRSNQSCHTMWLGLGSNVLFADGPLPFYVVSPRSFLKGIRQIGHQWVIDAGVNCAQIARSCSRLGYRDAVFFAGIPGTLGGALRMNAGAFGGETWRHVDWVDVMYPNGDVCRLDADQFGVSYRSVVMPETMWFLRAGMTFRDLRSDSQQSQIGLLLKKRMSSQPIGCYSCGSVFKNPENDFAARLIESAGLKGYRIGDAEVSSKHANFMINVKGRAASADMYRLMKEVKDAVFQTHQVNLEPEVHCYGFD